ncbi:MAG: Uma2 family endonuclease [Leptolyngbyaceae cyanobacterium SL_1_1]|nr:Uma2 family endonuclease [Leptolyngbyaceae cyanobacterium RM1_1_2]NJO10365.1 Uma2 family endonuclease [Leptolyngbyaceae cyanobacterium SL_1_1]
MLSATLKHFSLAEYHRLADLDFLQASDRIELIRGELMQMAAKGTAHEVCLTRLLRELPKCLGDDFTLRCQSPITLPPDSEPEPDFAIVQNRADDYLDHHPYSADILLLIEISDSSITYDREVKLPLYAENGVADYWIFNLAETILECYSEPYFKPTGSWAYRTQRVCLATEAIALPNLSDQPSLLLSKVFPLRR